MTHETPDASWDKAWDDSAADMSCAECRELLPDLIGGSLPATKRRAVERHLASCASCRAESRQWGAIAAAVRASDSDLQPAIPFPHSWAELSNRLPAPAVEPKTRKRSDSMDRNSPAYRPLGVRERDHRANQHTSWPDEDTGLHDALPHGHHRHLSPWAVAVAIAAVIVLVAGFAQVFAHFRGTTQPAPAATPAPPQWQSVTLPQVGAGQTLYGFAVSPSDGDVAFLCALAPKTPGAEASLWVTHDRGQTWTHATDVPLQRGGLTSCSVIPDRSSSSTLVVTLAYGPSAVNGSFPLVSYATTDGGGSWRSLPFPSSTSVFDLATAQGKTYALLNMPPNAQGVTTRLEVSADQMRTWRPIDGDLLLGGHQVSQVFADPSSGQLVVEGDLFAEGMDNQLYLTSDGGQTWRQVGPLLGSHQSYVAAPPSGGHPWRFCALVANTRRATFALLTASCSMDGGQSWQDIPGVNERYGPSVKPRIQLAGLLPDGTLVGDVWLWDGSNPSNSSNNHVDVFRVAPGSHQWQIWGAGMVGGIMVAPTPGGGATLWTVNVVQPGSAVPWQISVAQYPG